MTCSSARARESSLHRLFVTTTAFALFACPAPSALAADAAGLVRFMGAPFVFAAPLAVATTHLASTAHRASTAHPASTAQPGGFVPPPPSLPSQPSPPPDSPAPATPGDGTATTSEPTLPRVAAPTRSTAATSTLTATDTLSFAVEPVTNAATYFFGFTLLDPDTSASPVTIAAPPGTFCANGACDSLALAWGQTATEPVAHLPLTIAELLAVTRAHGANDLFTIAATLCAARPDDLCAARLAWWASRAHDDGDARAAELLKLMWYAGIPSRILVMEASPREGMMTSSGDMTRTRGVEFWLDGVAAFAHPELGFFTTDASAETLQRATTGVVADLIAQNLAPHMFTTVPRGYPTPPHSYRIEGVVFYEDLLKSRRSFPFRYIAAHYSGTGLDIFIDDARDWNTYWQSIQPTLTLPTLTPPALTSPSLTPSSPGSSSPSSTPVGFWLAVALVATTLAGFLIIFVASRRARTRGKPMPLKRHQLAVAIVVQTAIVAAALYWAAPHLHADASRSKLVESFGAARRLDPATVAPPPEKPARLQVTACAAAYAVPDVSRSFRPDGTWWSHPAAPPPSCTTFDWIVTIAPR